MKKFIITMWTRFSTKEFLAKKSTQTPKISFYLKKSANPFEDALFIYNFIKKNNSLNNSKINYVQKGFGDEAIFNIQIENDFNCDGLADFIESLIVNYNVIKQVRVFY